MMKPSDVAKSMPSTDRIDDMIAQLDAILDQIGADIDKADSVESVIDPLSEGESGTTGVTGLISDANDLLSSILTDISRQSV